MIYLDYNSTAPMLEAVKEVVVELFGFPYNPSSIHSFGRRAKYIIEEARINIFKLLDISNQGYDIVFTSGGTESNNLILSNFKDKTIITSPVEHLSILNCKDFCKDFRFIKLSQKGLIDLEDLEEILKSLNNPESTLVSIIYANNETGIIEQIKEISDLCKNYDVWFHSDAVQALGKIEMDLKNSDIDFITMSGHKIGAPIGAGLLIYKKEANLLPYIYGGGQEKNLRSGTENVIAIKGFEKALEITIQNLSFYIKKSQNLRGILEEKILGISSNAKIIGKDLARLPNTSNILMKGVSSERQLIEFDLKNIAISTGSACSSGKISKSHVLKAMGIKEEDVASSIRVSLGNSNNEEDINKFVEIWAEIHDTRI
jgi:cysteine desulfurase